MVKVLLFGTIGAAAVTCWVTIGVISYQRSQQTDEKKEAKEKEITWWDWFKKMAVK